MADEKPGLIQGFKDFVMRGNVIDLAVAVVVGAAFTAVVKSFSDEIIAPIIAAFGGLDTGGLGFCLKSGDGCTAANPTFIDLGAVFSVLVSFLITMLVVYFVFVMPMNKARQIAARKKEAGEEVDEPADDVVLLTEIRDLLARQQDTPRT
jgi:large conductance mechanosensitive channel